MPQDADAVVINDFTPGIHQQRYSSATASVRQGPPKLGAASIENTYRCVASPDGALGPMPRRVPTAMTATPRGTLTTPVNYPTTNHIALFTSDALVDAETNDVANLGGPDETAVYISHVFVYQSRDWNFVTEYALSNNVASDIAAWASQGTPVNMRIQAAPICRGVSTNDTATAPYVGDKVNPVIAGGYSVINTLMSATGADATLVALRRNTFVTQSYGGTGSTLFRLWYWPNQDGTTVNPGDTTTFTGKNLLDPAIEDEYNPGSGIGLLRTVQHMTFHQGRLVYTTYAQHNFGGGFRIHFREAIGYQAPYKMSTFDSPGYLIPGEESSTGYGAVASMNAGELVFIKHDGGCLVVRGDIAQPTLVNLPMVDGTFGVTCVPCVTPLGLVYLSKHGVFAWNGQDSSQRLSPQIDGDFTDYSPVFAHLGSRGRLAWWYPFIAVPNNFMFDTRTGSWWRLDNPADHDAYNCYDSDHKGRLFAVKYRTTQADNIPFDIYSHTDQAYDYSWQSLPLIDEIVQGGKDTWDSYATVELVTERATGGTPTVTVTVTPLDERGVAGTPGTATFALSSSSVNGPSTMRVNLDRAVKARCVQVRIVANGGGVAAPLVRSCSLRRRPSKGVTSDLTVKGR